MSNARRRLRVLVPESAAGDGPAAARAAGFKWEATSSTGELLRGLETDPPDVVLLSFGFEAVDPAFAHRISQVLAGEGQVLLSAPRASLEWAVAAKRIGNGSLLGEPLASREIRLELQSRAGDPEGLLISSVRQHPAGAGLVGSGPAMMEIVRSVAQVGDSPATVLITGESGTGKELVARALHWASSRRGGPFVAINCAAVPETLLESEFFGHERGAFTGAVARRLGRFEKAAGGTLFLDEVGDMSLVLQAKLLRAIEEREVERVGGEGPVAVDVRVVAATNRPLEALVAEGEFREDLYFRLAVARIHLPPLQSRLEDLEELIAHFVSEFSGAYGRPVRGVGADALHLLAAHRWPGNVRELRNVLDRAVLTCRGGWIRAEDILLGNGSPSLASRGPENASGGYPRTYRLRRSSRTTSPGSWRSRAAPWRGLPGSSGFIGTR